MIRIVILLAASSGLAACVQPQVSEAERALRADCALQQDFALPEEPGLGTIISPAQAVAYRACVVAAGGTLP